MRWLRDLLHDLFGKRETPAEWARKCSDQELMGCWTAGPDWLDYDLFDAVMDEMDRRGLDRPHVQGWTLRWKR
jgi:hypothetical protein